MASLISGYNYDIFISYRQKDNKHDGWVTEFVNQLKGELEATFKEDISIYFDENPSDGLLETHSVDKSLEGKLKCLIFIPIISQTYCDPKSYAWQHEFCAFNTLAREDQFGRDIKLSSGNVASRILPIKIHDLDPDDKALLENEMGGVLRSIEFIYKEAGVNRPLKPNDDAKENLNKTHYINQVNKVANAVKEIITALKKQSQHLEEVAKQDLKLNPTLKKNLIKKIVAGSLITLALIILGFLFIPTLFKSSEQLEKSIAVLPFINDSPDDNEENTPFINGLMEEILINLQAIKEFRVPGRTSVEKYRNDPQKSIPEIARELGVNYIVEGSCQKYGNTLRLRVQLIKATGKEDHLWANSYQQEIKETKDVFAIQSQIAKAIATELEAVITPREIQKIEKTPSANLEAYDAYLKGLFFYEKDLSAETPKAISWFKEAIRLDSSFSMPWTYLSMCYWRSATTADSPQFKEAKLANIRALDLDPESGIALVNMAEILDNEYNFEAAEEKIKQALKSDPENQYVLRNAGRLYTKLGKGDESISYCNQALQNDPNNPTALYYLAYAYFYAGRLQEARTVVTKSHELEYKELSTLYYQILLEEGNFERIIKEPSYEGNNEAGNVAIAASNFALGYKNKAEEQCSNLKERKMRAYWIAFIYAFGNESDKVYEWLDKSYNLKEKEFTFIGVDPAFKKFRADPKFKQLVQKLKFPV
ncbi:MAG: tetratricopeptide repeat protein [Bacteroidia bacterium]|nr:tetratricopeptide repeat protein [Bacteroidia bacterium]